MKQKIPAILFLSCFCISLLLACSRRDTPSPDRGVTQEKSTENLPDRDNTPKVMVPSASADVVYGNDLINIDASHTDQGYIMVQYKGTNEKVRLRLAGPDEVTYTFAIRNTGHYGTFPFPAGSGSYKVTLLESLEGDEYLISFVQDISVTLADEFLPFLYPNQYVDFTPDSKAVTKARVLIEEAKTDLDVVGAIYAYVIGTIEYDDSKANNVSFGYTPNVDETLNTGTGICFDYASLMTAMLRSQGIPTKLGVGYAAEVYHAWISIYITDIGWIDNMIEFDGHSWKLMDPTFAANNDSDTLKRFIGDGNNYVLKYTY